MSAGTQPRNRAFELLMMRLDEMAPLLTAEGDQCDIDGKLTDRVVQALHDSGVLRMSIPRELGGYEVTPRQALQILEKVTYADASTGWNVLALSVIIGMTAAFQGRDASEEWFGDGRYIVIAGQGSRLGTAKKVDNGYLLSGTWQFASGSALASHIHSAALVEETGEPRMFTVPKEQVEIFDNWDVMGLRATASNDYACRDVFVPASATFGVTAHQPVFGGAMYRMGLANMVTINHAGWALGVGRRMLDELKKIAAQKTGTPGATVDNQQFYAEFAMAESKLRSARALAFEVWAECEATLEAGVDLSTEQDTLIRLSLANATWSAHDVAATVYKWAGTSGLRRGPIQRFFRDMNAGTQHVTSGPGAVQGCGRHLAGLASNASWQAFTLVAAE